MGVNLGDIVIEPDNLHGEGINVAARLEAMAPPGGILTTEEVARHVDGKVPAGLGFVGKRTVKNIEAYEHYLRARHARHPGTLRSTRLAYWTLEKAIELEPGFAEALALLADVYALHYNGADHPMDWDRPPAIAGTAAEAFARRAKGLNPALGAPVIALAHLRLAELRFDAALPHARRAVELEPGLSESHVVLARSLSALGYHQEALRDRRRADRLR